MTCGLDEAVKKADTSAKRLLTASATPRPITSSNPLATLAAAPPTAPVTAPTTLAAAPRPGISAVAAPTTSLPPGGHDTTTQEAEAGAAAPTLSAVAATIAATHPARRRRGAMTALTRPVSSRRTRRGGW